MTRDEIALTMLVEFWRKPPVGYRGAPAPLTELIATAVETADMLLDELYEEEDDGTTIEYSLSDAELDAIHEANAGQTEVDLDATLSDDEIVAINDGTAVV